jgi:cytochrome c oxidase assembly protein subunit 15
LASLLSGRTNSKIEMSEFKKIFYMEWAHRIAGRVLGVA